MICWHNHLHIAQYHQHLTETLLLDMSVLAYMMSNFPGLEEEKNGMAICRFELTCKAQIVPMGTGQKSCVIFALLAWRLPHLFLLDEPTNHLDKETIDALIDALNEWDRGLVLVSHDFRLINQVAKEVVITL
jgi:ATP-binding cassette subfamily F protein 2